MAARLLLADDSVTIQRVIELTFADEDVEVIAVGDGEAAIARLGADPPDIVLADIGMPGQDGYAVAAHVKATPAISHIPVLLLAGAFEPDDEARVTETGSVGVLVKPFEPQMVISRVRSLLAERRAAPRAAEQPAVVPAQNGGAVPVPASQPSATASAPPAAAGRQQAVDDYFERLDAAFANLNAHLDEAPRAPAAPATQVPEPSPAPAPETAGLAPVNGPEPRSMMGAPLSMADAFDALLGVEQGQPPPLIADGWSPVLTEDLVEQVARRVAEQIGERIIRELAPGVVTEIAERLIREEIAKIKADAEAQ
jgi:CheY-like chemotaxis protein